MKQIFLLNAENLALAKKEALVSGDLAKLRKLSKSRKKSYVIYCRFTHYTLEKSEDFSSRLFSLLSTGL